jgi:hypothetical protein
MKDCSDDKRVGNGSFRVVRENMEVEPAFDVDGSANWDNVESLLMHGLQDCMRISPSEFPLLLSNNNYKDYLNSSQKVIVSV